MSDTVLAIDQGTTGTTALLLSPDVRVVATHNAEFKQHYPKNGWVEHDPEDIWASMVTAVRGALQNAPGAEVKAIGITNQRETCLFWDRKTGEAVGRAIVWQDRRTADLCQQLRDAGHLETVVSKTGLLLDPYFSGTKAKWILDNNPGARKRAAAGELCFGTIDTYLAWRLTGGEAHVTDPSNASRTLLFNIHTLDWDDELLELLDVPRACLPAIVDNAGVVGKTLGVDGLADGIAVAGLVGDQQGALFGQACFAKGDAKCTYGTGAFVLMNTGDEAVRSHAGLLTTVGWRIDGEVTYALEGSAFIAGAAVQWLRDELGFFKSASEIEDLAQTVPDSGGVVFVPALAGLGAPHWRPEARGLLWGMTRGTNRGHIARAVLEGVALQIGELLVAMRKDVGALRQLRVDGGAARNDLLMQFQADVLQLNCVRPTVLETTALGSAFLAGLGVGVWDSPQAIQDAWKQDASFEPQISQQEADEHIARWTEAVSRA